MKILSQLNRSLEKSEEEWALVEMLGMEFVIRLERGDEQLTALPNEEGPVSAEAWPEYGDVEWFTLEEMKEYPKTLRILMERKQG